ncbi:MAG: hypothetical protein CEE43_06030 [Promethearchaeota archaeon Loki_b32]|nr:MAG: hypothetical protein CEE43_06030 [Candidatus Lokiarchaeota archaeon Loki_b32]
MNQIKKSVSDLLDKGYGRLICEQGGKRGRVLHQVSTTYYKRIFKGGNKRNKVNYRIFSQNLTKQKIDILADIKKNPDYEIYQEDVKILLDKIHYNIRMIAKTHSKINYAIVIPKKIEIEFFGGEASFEVEEVGKIGGLKINARVDCLIELDSEKFIIREFKSYELNKDDEVSNLKSKNHREFMQTCLYGIIFEKARHQKCGAVQLVYFPNKVVSYNFTDDLRETAIKFAMNTAFEGFNGINFEFTSEDDEDHNDVKDSHTKMSDLHIKSASTTSFSDPWNHYNTNGKSEDEEGCLGSINTVKGKPLELVMGGDNQMKGYLYPNKAHLIRDGYCVIVEKEEDGVRIMCIVKKIECSEDHFPGETSSHKEDNYKITLNPVGQFTPEGYQALRPQTVIGGKIKIPTQNEFCEFKKIPQNGMEIASVEGLNAGIPYLLKIRTLYQSVFMSGQQGSGKTSALKVLSLLIAQEKDSPAQIILDNEGEYGDLAIIPSTKQSAKLMRIHRINALNLNNFRFINIGTDEGFCLTLKAIDPVDLPYFIHELTPISHDTLQTIIYDIIEENKGKEFTLPELKKFIFYYMENEIYSATSGTKSAIRRALNSISLRIFDLSDVEPIDFESMLIPGKITVINSYNLRDSHQRIVGLYLLAILHKRALKGKEKLKVFLHLDEIQRLLPKSRSQSDSEYLKRIVKFLDEIVHRGRKRDYGVAFATQSIMDVKKEIIDLCNTKIFLQTQGSGSNYLREYFNNKQDIERLKRLPQGHAYITSKGKHDPVEIKFPYIN